MASAREKSDALDAPKFHRKLIALRCDAAHWRCHEFWANRVADQFLEDPIDLRFGGSIERPAGHTVHGLQLIGMARAPQCRGDSLIEHPANRQMNDTFIKAFPCKLIESLHGGKILREPG